MQWYYSKNSTQLGPVEQGEMIAKISSGEITASDLVWREGMADWLPCGQVPELRATVALGQPQPLGGPAAGGPLSPYTPPQAAAHMGTYEVIPNYLWQSIVVTILCCWPLGIPAIVYAAKVEGLRNRGDIAGARAASANAKTWCWVSFGLGLGVILIYLALFVFGVLGASSSSSYRF